MSSDCAKASKNSCPSPALNPVPLPATADLSCWADLGTARLHLENLNPLDDPGAVAGQVAALTMDHVEIFRRMDQLEAQNTALLKWKEAHERRGNHCRRCAGRG